MIFLILLVTILLESTVITIPLTLISLLLFALYKKDESVLILGFFAGLLLDILSMDMVGKSSIFFVIYLALVLMYARRFEMGSIYYLALFSFFGSLVFLFISESSAILAQASLSTILSITISKLIPYKEEEVSWQQR